MNDGANPALNEGFRATHRRSLAGALALGGLFALGMIVSAGVLGKAFVDGRRERFVTVRGLSEREVKADTAVWPIQFSVGSQDLATAYGKSASDKEKVLAFLASGGMQKDEIEIGQIEVHDNEAREYGGERAANRFIVRQPIVVNTKKVDAVATLATRVADLVKAGVVFDATQGIAYHFTGVNEIKPGMLAEATKNARAAAAQFAADSGAKVGAIIHATQGALSIVSLVSAPSGEGGFEGGAEHSLKQKLRVVMTVDFRLE